MSLKHIVLPLDGEPHGEAVALAALRIAQQFGAHVSAGYEDALGPLYAPTMGFIPSAQVFGDFYEQMQTLRTQRVMTARRHFDGAIGATRLPIVSEVACSRGSAMWLQDGEGASLSQLGLLFDLAVVPAPGKDLSPGPWSVVENLLFGASAPVLLMPRGVDAVDFRRPLVAWNGSREAVRALQSALPLLPKDAKPVLLEVGRLARGRVPVQRAAEYLGWHCCPAELRAVEGKDHEVPAILQQQAKDLRASCVIMGAYTHGRTRQFLLGGLTDFVFREAALPTVMCH